MRPRKLCSVARGARFPDLAAKSRSQSSTGYGSCASSHSPATPLYPRPGQPSDQMRVRINLPSRVRCHPSLCLHDRGTHFQLIPRVEMADARICVPKVLRHVGPGCWPIGKSAPSGGKVNRSGPSAVFQRCSTPIHRSDFTSRHRGQTRSTVLSLPGSGGG